MKIQLILFFTFVAGAIFSTWMLIVTSKSVHKERMNLIEEKVRSLGGNVINIEQVQRNSFPFSEEYKDVELSYKFYKVKYTLEDKLVEDWVIQGMRQAVLGGNGTIHSKWIWRS
jgi:hypothetical protein